MKAREQHVTTMDYGPCHETHLQLTLVWSKPVLRRKAHRIGDLWRLGGLNQSAESHLA